jgi:hypothetical protein
MTILTRLHAWWAARRPKPLREQLAVRFDDDAVAVRVLADFESGWNQDFRWEDIERVCFTDGGLYGSDMIHVAVRGRADRAVIPTEAAGGSAFFGALSERGLFPEVVWRRAIGDTSGGTHCWPPSDGAPA